MRKKKTILWLGILLILLIGAGWAWHLYDKPHRSTADESSDLTINADSLYHQYQSDEKAADQKYMGKVLSITGRLTDIQHSGKAEIWILSAQADGGGVNCQLFAGTKADPEPRPGDAVTVKGRCTGFLMDVNMVDCVPER
jgi:hypothetical protein